MTDKQKKFVEAKLKGKTGKQAVIDAGYDVKDDNTAMAIASQNLRKLKVKEQLDSRRAEIEAQTDIEVSDIVQELKSIAFQPGKILNNSDKLRALELLGKYKMMFVDRSISENVDYQGDTPKTELESLKERIKRLEALESQPEGIEGQPKPNIKIA